MPPGTCLSFFMCESQCPQRCVDLRTGREARATFKRSNVLQAEMEATVVSLV